MYETVQGQEEMVAGLVRLGKNMLANMEEGGEAEGHIDSKLTELDSRLSDLVTPVEGKLDSKKNDVSKVRVNQEIVGRSV